MQALPQCVTDHRVHALPGCAQTAPRRGRVPTRDRGRKLGSETRPTLYSYVVDHDTGYAPNPYFGLCTLCRCKFRKFPNGRKDIVELAEEGDWVIGTGGASKRSAGHGKLVSAMHVDKKHTRWEYFTDRRSETKKPLQTGTYEQTRGDNECPCTDFEKHEQFVLVSWHFYYFGANALVIPARFNLAKKGPGFRSHFDPADICQFLKWLENSRALGNTASRARSSS
jgi:Nucleotide modification associated domain 2